MIDSNFVYLAAIISFAGAVSYIVDTLKGKTKPNRVSWFIWALAPLIAFAAQLNEGVGKEAILTFMVGFNPLLIFIASFVNKKSEWKIGKLDITCGVLSIIGLIIWLVLKEGTIAIAFGIIADGLASVPTIIKSYKYPETENYMGFLTGAISAIITLLTITIWNFANIGFPIYIFLVCTILTILIKFKIGKKASI